MISIFNEVCLAQKGFDSGRDGASVGASGQTLGGDSHHLAHVTGTGGSGFGDNLTQFGVKFLGGERLGQIFFDDGGLGEFVLGEFRAVVLAVYAGRFDVCLYL